MTRDEAIEIIGGEQGWPSIAGGACAAWVDIFAALGMLKLEEPKSPNEQAIDALFARCGGEGGMITPRRALEVIDSAGLKIVEK